MSDHWKQYTTGATDSKGRQIEAIYSHHDTHVIYRAAGRLEVDGSTEKLDSDSEINLLLSQILVLAPDDESAKKIHFIQLSQAINSCLSGDISGCRKNLKTILQSLKNKKSAVARLVFLWSAIAFCVLVWITILLLYLIFDRASDPWPYVTWALVIAFSATGGALSVAVRQDLLPVDPDREPQMHASNGMSRIVLAILSGVACYLAIKSGVVLSILDKWDGGYAVFFFCFVSGFSERFIPNVLSDAEAKI